MQTSPEAPAKDNAGVKFPPPAIFLGALFAGFAVDEWLDLPTLGLAAPARYLIAAGFFAAGVALIVGAVRLFRAADTNAPPWMPATALVISGVYKFTRNPMYVGMALISVAIAVVVGSLAALALLVPALAAIQFGVIAKEERYMEAKFGAAYAEYKAKVRRWL